MQVPFVDLKAQYLTIKPAIDQAIQDVIANASFVGGKFLTDFESDFGQFIGRKNCIGCGNGTDALQMALQSMNIGTEDEVIVPANTFIATSEAVTATGARVVFCDADDQTNNLDTNLIEEKITANTKAIIAVHLYGRVADMEAIMAIAEKYNLKVIEDAAQAHGARVKSSGGGTQNWKIAGTLGHVATFSFYPGKNLGAYGDGGAILMDDDNLAEKIRKMSNHGRSEKYNHEFEGYNSRLDGLQAAILGVKLRHLQQWSVARRAVAQRYNQGLDGVGDLILPLVDYDLNESVFHLYVIKTNQRDDLQAYLKEQGIATGIHYPIGLPFLRAYKYLGHQESDFPVTARNQHRLLSLPMYAELPTEQQDYVIEKIVEFYK